MVGLSRDGKGGRKDEGGRMREVYGIFIHLILRFCFFFSIIFRDFTLGLNKDKHF